LRGFLILLEYISGFALARLHDAKVVALMDFSWFLKLVQFKPLSKTSNCLPKCAGKTIVAIHQPGFDIFWPWSKLKHFTTRLVNCKQ